MHLTLCIQISIGLPIIHKVKCACKFHHEQSLTGFLPAGFLQYQRTTLQTRDPLAHHYVLYMINCSSNYSKHGAKPYPTGTSGTLGSRDGALRLSGTALL